MNEPDTSLPVTGPHHNACSGGIMAQTIVAEEWRPVVGFEGRYEVSDIGRVRSLLSGGTILRPRANHLRFGYLQINLRHGGSRRVVTRTVHRIVLEAFVGPKPVGKQCNHIDGDKSNNRLSNLEWVTCGENHIHAARMGLYARSKISIHNIGEIRKRLARGEMVRTLARSFSVCDSTIGHIKAGRTWRHIRW